MAFATFGGKMFPCCSLVVPFSKIHSLNFTSMLKIEPCCMKVPVLTPRVSHVALFICGQAGRVELREPFSFCIRALDVYLVYQEGPFTASSFSVYLAVGT